eukprot:scaffold118359_cov72-Phaeocystis_antarctica.AAC.2
MLEQRDDSACMRHSRLLRQRLEGQQRRRLHGCIRIPEQRDDSTSMRRSILHRQRLEGHRRRRLHGCIRIPEQRDDSTSMRRSILHRQRRKGPQRLHPHGCIRILKPREESNRMRIGDVHLRPIIVVHEACDARGYMWVRERSGVCPAWERLCPNAQLRAAQAPCVARFAERVIGSGTVCWREERRNEARTA